MSDIHPGVLASRAVACPTCGVEAGALCVTMDPWRKPSESVHYMRALELAATTTDSQQEER